MRRLPTSVVPFDSPPAAAAIPALPARADRVARAFAVSVTGARAVNGRRKRACERRACERRARRTCPVGARPLPPLPSPPSSLTCPPSNVHSSYRVLSRAGDGTYGTVWAASHRDTGALVAIKRFRRTFGSWADAVALREVRALRALRGAPGVVALREVVREGDALFLVFEHMVRLSCVF
jgi:hypothetical protein